MVRHHLFVSSPCSGLHLSATGVVLFSVPTAQEPKQILQFSYLARFIWLCELIKVEAESRNSYLVKNQKFKPWKRTDSLVPLLLASAVNILTRHNINSRYLFLISPPLLGTLRFPTTTTAGLTSHLQHRDLAPKLHWGQTSYKPNCISLSIIAIVYILCQEMLRTYIYVIKVTTVLTLLTKYFQCSAHPNLTDNHHHMRTWM